MRVAVVVVLLIILIALATLAYYKLCSKIKGYKGKIIQQRPPWHEWLLHLGGTFIRKEEGIERKLSSTQLKSLIEHITSGTLLNPLTHCDETNNAKPRTSILGNIMADISNNTHFLFDTSVPHTHTPAIEDKQHTHTHSLGSLNPRKPSISNEDKCRKILEDIFNTPFPTVRPDFLRNTLHPQGKGRNLEIDGFSAKLRLGFEYQGYQHREYPNKFHKTLDEHKYLKATDELKKQLLHDNKINMIYVLDTIPPDKFYDYIIEQCEQLGYVEIVD